MTNQTTINGASLRARAEYNRLVASLAAQGKAVNPVVDLASRKTRVTITKVGHTPVVGKARCHADDTFNVNIGLVIALYRALSWDVPREYIGEARQQATRQPMTTTQVQGTPSAAAESQAQSIINNTFGIQPSQPTVVEQVSTVATVVTAADITAVKAEFKGDVNSLAFALASLRKATGVK